MAQVVLGGLGGALGGGIGRGIGAVLGGALDRGFVAGLGPARQVGPRLETLKLQSTAEGSPMACVFGRARVTGQMIWAARFLERRQQGRAGKGGPRTVDYAYSLSFAVALCEGPIDGVGRVWADGRPLDLTGVTMRVHRGTDEQTPDPLIEAVEGAAPAYRGTAYVVFEDLPLGPFGDRAPQLSFEVFRRPEGDGLEERLEGVCLIPGAGEFVLATQVVHRREGLTRTKAENAHHPEGGPDFLVSIEQLKLQCPNLKRVSLVIGWFGDDLRAGHCQVRPGVEGRDRATEPLGWSVAGLNRGEAHLVSQFGGAPAYGGTPSDQTVRQAVAALKAQGWAVTLYPFVFMDVPPGNGLPDPYGEAEQAAYPWRGRVKGVDGAGAAAEIGSLFGTATGWGLRRLALHYAQLAAETGADGLLIGSEMRGVTRTRDAGGAYPAIGQYRTLAAECRAIVGPDVALSYAADWSEYFGHQANGEVRFQLDPLWADPAIDYVGVDWYPPLGDWREGDGGLDAASWEGPSDSAYLAAQVAGGEGFDWFYASEADRAAQVRTAITDGAHGEPWVFRPKDLVGWWSHAHHERIGGVRSATPTNWTPRMKPIRLTEFGCAAVNRGGNAPNLFQDPKSSESQPPPYSTTLRDDRMQRRALEAVLKHFAEPENNPASLVYGGPMVEGADAWCWDARPFPAFPALSKVWADAGAWTAGHWLNGRLNGDGAQMLAAVLKRGGLEEDEFSIGATTGEASGYVIDRPMRTRDALAPLLQAFDMAAAERDGKVALIGREPPVATLNLSTMAAPEEGASITAERVLEAQPGTARVRFVNEASDYQTGAVTARGPGQGGGVERDLPVVCGAGLATAAAQRLLGEAAGETLTGALGPLEALRLEPGDCVAVEGMDGVWRIERLAVDETPTATLTRVRVVEGGQDAPWAVGEADPVGGAPFVGVLDLPPLLGHEDDARPLAAVAGEPWRRMTLWGGPSETALTARAEIAAPARVGTLVEPLGAGAPNRWDHAGALVVRSEGRPEPESLSELAVLGGANAMAIQTAVGWEIVQYRTATLVGADVWRLTGLLRGQQGCEDEMRAGAAAGATVVSLDARLTRIAVSTSERGLPWLWRAGPTGGPPGGEGVAEVAGTVRGVHGRPWSPAHLRAADVGGDLRLRWIPRSRSADVWDGEGAPSDPLRFRVRILVGESERRTFEVEGLEAIYDAAAQAADFPGGAPEGLRATVAQFGGAWGWGVEASVALA